MIRIGTAGWSLYRGGAEFDGTGTALQRYARVFSGVEINSSFYRAHPRTTYAKWAAVVPVGFRFAVKLPQVITHEQRLRRARGPLLQFAAQVAGLGRKLGPLLVQLPPSLEFDRRSARSFFDTLREVFEGSVVCEPRHASWFTAGADTEFEAFEIGRVAADPAPLPAGALPGGWSGILYLRLHGSPRRYWSVYDDARLREWSQLLRATPRRTPAWCIFDNTAGGGAIANARHMMRLCERPRTRSSGVRRPHG